MTLIEASIEIKSLEIGGSSPRSSDEGICGWKVVVAGVSGHSCHIGWNCRWLSSWAVTCFPGFRRFLSLHIKRHS